MADDDWREALQRANATTLALAACNKLLIASTTLLASICILLAGLLGFVLGRLSSAEGSQWSSLSENILPRRFSGRPTTVASQHGAAQGRRSLERRPEKKNDGGGNAPHTESPLENPSETVLAPRLRSSDNLRPNTTEKRGKIQDLDSAQESGLVPPPSKKQQVTTTELRVSPRSSPQSSPFAADREATQMWKHKHLTEEARTLMTNFAGLWDNIDTPWADSTFAEGRQINNSRRSSTNQDIYSSLVAQLSTEQQWRHPPLNYRDSGSQHGFLHENWVIELDQLQFMVGPDGKRVILGKGDESSDVVTYRATLDGKVDVVVKYHKLNKEVMPDDKVKALALQQMSLNASPQMLFFYGACRTEEALMLVYEHIKGGNLRQALLENPSGMKWYANGKAIARDVALGLAYLHRHDMEHRSLKTSQVLVRSSDLTAKVADSGLQAITRHCLRSRSFRFGCNMEYGAPEVLLGNMCGCDTDIFALGSVLLELVTQEKPIRGASRAPVCPQECPLPISDLIRRCMHREPQLRPTADEAIDVIQRAWNMTEDGGGQMAPPTPLRPDAQARRARLSTSKSQPAPLGFLPQLAVATTPRAAAGSDSGSGRAHGNPILQDGPSTSPSFGRKGGRTPGLPPPSPASSPSSSRRNSLQGATRKANSFNGHVDSAAQRALIAQGSFRAAASPPRPARRLGEVKYLERHLSSPSATDQEGGMSRRQRSRSMKSVRSASSAGEHPAKGGRKGVRRLETSMKHIRDDIFMQTRPRSPIERNPFGAAPGPGSSPVKSPATGRVASMVQGLESLEVESYSRQNSVLPRRVSPFTPAPGKQPTPGTPAQAQRRRTFTPPPQKAAALAPEGGSSGSERVPTPEADFHTTASLVLEGTTAPKPHLTKIRSLDGPSRVETESDLESPTGPTSPTSDDGEPLRGSDLPDTRGSVLANAPLLEKLCGGTQVTSVEINSKESVFINPFTQAPDDFGWNRYGTPAAATPAPPLLDLSTSESGSDAAARQLSLELRRAGILCSEPPTPRRTAGMQFAANSVSDAASAPLLSRLRHRCDQTFNKLLGHVHSSSGSSSASLTATTKSM